MTVQSNLPTGASYYADAPFNAPLVDLCGHEEDGLVCEERAVTQCSNPACRKALCDEHHINPGSIMCFECMAEVWRAERRMFQGREEKHEYSRTWNGDERGPCITCGLSKKASVHFEEEC